MSKITREQLLPTKWILNGIPSRDACAAQWHKLRKIDHAYAREFVSDCICIGIWPVSWRRADGTRALFPE